MRLFVSNKDLEELKNLVAATPNIEFHSIEEHDNELKTALLKEVRARLLHYKPQIVDDIGLCVSATILDFFEHIPEELAEKWEEK